MRDFFRKKEVKETVSIGLHVVAAIVIALFIINFVGTRSSVAGTSMEPTLSDSDGLIVERISYRFHGPERFDIVVFPHIDGSGDHLIKRVIGLPGESVQIISGMIYINGVLMQDKYGSELMKHAGIASFPIYLGEDEYFVLGDNRNNSLDSRDPRVGALHRDEFEGRAFVRIWPLSDFGLIGHE
ncbi:MAG: signal peptidase I [Lachnospiraceae bacterium]|nr:signal peptidase I [Lachnospiraceae bacterium]